MRSSVIESALLQERDAGVLTLTLNRPECRNAIDPALRDALAQALDRAATDPDVRALVLTGAGLNFCAGGDLGGFEELHDPRVYRHVSHRLTDLIESIERLEKPVVAAIDGAVTGLLSELSTASDDLLPVAHRRLTRMLERAPLSFGAAKRLLQIAADVDLRSGMVAESLAQTALLQSADHREGLAAARVRRPPRFEGR